jgi:hypothetical protein
MERGLRHSSLIAAHNGDGGGGGSLPDVAERHHADPPPLPTAVHHLLYGGENRPPAAWLLGGCVPAYGSKTTSERPSDGTSRPSGRASRNDARVRIGVRFDVHGRHDRILVVLGARIDLPAARPNCRSTVQLPQLDERIVSRASEIVHDPAPRRVRNLSFLDTQGLPASMRRRARTAARYRPSPVGRSLRLPSPRSQPVTGADSPSWLDVLGEQAGSADPSANHASDAHHGSPDPDRRRRGSRPDWTSATLGPNAPTRTTTPRLSPRARAADRAAPSTLDGAAPRAHRRSPRTRVHPGCPDGSYPTKATNPTTVRHGPTKSSGHILSSVTSVPERSTAGTGGAPKSSQQPVDRPSPTRCRSGAPSTPSQVVERRTGGHVTGYVVGSMT